MEKLHNEFALKLGVELKEHQRNFFERITKKKHYFETWPRQSGKTLMGRLIVLYKLLVEDTDLVSIIYQNYQEAYKEISMIASVYKTIFPENKIERPNRNILKFSDGKELRVYTYSSFITNENYKSLRDFHVHMDEYKRADKKFKQKWPEIRLCLDNITGISSLE